MKLNQFLAENVHLFDENYSISGNKLKAIIPDLLNLEEFKNVTEINIINSPNYMADLSQKPIDPIKEPLMREDEKELIQSVIVRHGTTVTFNSIINLYSIQISQPTYDKEIWDDLGKGVYMSPPFFSSKDFIPMKELRVRFSLDYPQDPNNVDPDFDNKVRKELLDQVDKALSGNPNMPNKRAIMFRCSSNSIKTNEEKDCYVYNVNFPVKQL